MNSIYATNQPRHRLVRKYTLLQDNINKNDSHEHKRKRKNACVFFLCFVLGIRVKTYSHGKIMLNERTKHRKKMFSWRLQWTGLRLSAHSMARANSLSPAPLSP